MAAVPRLVVALDCAGFDAADALVQRLDPALCRLKVGKELFTSAGPSCIEAWRRRGFDVFLDLKYHDIPNTVESACRAAGELGVWMITVHALGGRRMLEAAARGVTGDGSGPLLVAVTVLTSLEDTDLAELGIDRPVAELAPRLASLARDCGCDGVVCSAREAAAMRQACGDDFVLVTPGIRPAGPGDDDQRRTVTPAEAMRAGADYLVVGRPITAAADPAVALRALAAEVDPSLFD